MKTNMVSKEHPALPESLRKKIGILLRQGRTARQLSVTKAAFILKIDVDTLNDIEAGSIEYSGIVAQKIAQIYGIHEVTIDSILFEWTLFDLRNRAICERRNNLSLVGPKAKSWENHSEIIGEVKERI